jgi:hypothetical protein
LGVPPHERPRPLGLHAHRALGGHRAYRGAGRPVTPGGAECAVSRASSGRSEQASRETPEQAAARVFDLAQNLEKEHKTKEAFAAYRQILRHYPATAGGEKAADRIAQAQQSAILRKQK